MVDKGDRHQKKKMNIAKAKESGRTVGMNRIGRREMLS